MKFFMNKKIKQILIYLNIVCIFSISLAGCSKTDNNQVLKDKIKSELSYLDTKLVEMLNNVNGISIQNYIIKAEEVNEKSGSGDTKSSKFSNESKEQNSQSSEETGSQGRR